MRKYRVDLAEQVLDKYLTVKTKYPNTYQKLTLISQVSETLYLEGMCFLCRNETKMGELCCSALQRHWMPPDTSSLISSNLSC
ncbi:hypothetical protein CEXT_756121 [Caerostris extrusa]|uniref:Uncharacterized protein n=1 Tax=Caerostris extrusa TaxID=172846 RepID=A0AAV4NGU4_CAEEX|nr:hypothetical protein CEXT_756121 [Caerostris extrusa]